jgi:parvulin-like peptidyl-prolyl isomerase
MLQGAETLRTNLFSCVRSALHDPLTHFVAAGAAIFALFAATGELRRPVVRIDQGEIDQLAAYWQAQSGRGPTRQELNAMLEERIDEEIMAAEAVRLGLDRDDVIVRRRLAQKYAFVREDLAAPPEPDERALRAYHAAHGDLFASRDAIALRQIFFSAERGAEDARTQASAAALRLKRNPHALIDGDVFMMPLAYAGVAEADLRRDYGAEFAAVVAAAPVGVWTGPVQSPFGWHLVRVEGRTPAQTSDFAAVREAVRARWLEDSLARARAADRRKLRRLYRIELPESAR